SLTAMPASASRREPMICSSEKRFSTSNLLVLRDWTPNHRATQRRGDVATRAVQEVVQAFGKDHGAFRLAQGVAQPHLLEREQHGVAGTLLNTHHTRSGLGVFDVP